MRRKRPADGVGRHWPDGMLLLTLLLVGCTRTFPPLIQSTPAQSTVAFPPQQVMEQGNYSEFLAENQRLLGQCGEGKGCDVALFNLGFVHAYPSSPYRDPVKALQYFGDLRAKYPQSPWAVQGQVWMVFLRETLTLEESRRRLQADLRTREATIRGLRGQLNRAREIDIEHEKKERELVR